MARYVPIEVAYFNKSLRKGTTSIHGEQKETGWKIDNGFTRQQKNRVKKRREVQYFLK